MRTHYCFGRRETGELSREAINGLIAEGRDRQAALAALPIEAILGVLERVGASWAEPNSPHRLRVLAELPAQIGFSREMVEQELLGLTMALTRPYLEGKLKAELGRIDAQDLWHRKPGSRAFQKAVPHGLVLHVASGNVSTTGVLSLIEGLLARNVNVLKVASNAPLMPLLFADSLAACDDTGVVAASLAVIGWSGEKTPHHELFQAQADAIVVWGGDETVAVYRHGLSPATKLIAYGPKVSAALFGRQALEAEDLSALALEAARDVSLWDQAACSSPQVFYLEDPSPDHCLVQRFAAALAPAFAAIAKDLPIGALTVHEKAEITKEREMALFGALAGQGTLTTAPDQTWTIVCEWDPEFKLSPLFRTITLKPLPCLDDAWTHLAPYRAYLQTIALAVTPERAGGLAEAAAAAGAQRIVRIGQASGGFPGEPHDGVYGLHELVRWVSLDTPEAADAFDGTAFASAERQQAIALAKRKRLLSTGLASSPFYRRHLGDAAFQPNVDWESLPLLIKADVQANTPPNGHDLFAGPLGGAHWLRSGGSTGDPKLSIFSYEDYEEDMWRAARGAHAAGLRAGERVANLFFAGDLYGSFLSLNRTLELVGCASFPFTQNAPIESVLHCLKAFRIEAVMGLSTWVQTVLAEAAREGGDYHVKRVYYAGEPFHEKERRALVRNLGITRVASIGYGAVDAGPMGYQCDHCQGGVHHLHDDHVYLEIIDPDTGRSVPAGTAGEIVVTNLNRRLMPLVRYRIGDLGRWVTDACPCGRPGRRFELLGRTDERVRLVPGDVHYAEVQRLVAGFEPLHSSVQLLVGARRRGSLSVRAELLEVGPDANALAAELERGLVARLPLLADPTVDLSVEVVPPGGLERVGRTGKIVRVIVDRREQSR